MKLQRFSGKPRKYKFYVRRIIGDSMLPALRPGRIVVGVAGYRQVRPGDVVIIDHEGLEKIKRIQKMRFGLLYVVGDNLPHSTDSRAFGWLPASAVRARLIWPRR